MSTVQVVSPMNCLFYPQKGVSNLDMMMNPTNAGGSNCDKYYSNNNDSNSSRDDVNDQAHPFLRFNSTEAFASQQSIQEDAKKPSFRSLSPLTSSSKGMPLPAGFVPGPMDGKFIPLYESLVFFQIASDSATYAVFHPVQCFASSRL